MIYIYDLYLILSISVKYLTERQKDLGKTWFMEELHSQRPAASESMKHTQCDAIRWKQFLRRCRLGQLWQGISGWRQHLGQDIWKQICLEFYLEDFKFSEHFTKMHSNIRVAIKLNFMSSLFYSAATLQMSIFFNLFLSLKY